MNRTKKLDDIRNKVRNSMQISSQLNKDLIEKDNQEKKYLQEFNIFYINQSFEELYKDKEILGEGCVGVVKKVIRKSDKEIFACKMVKSNDEETLGNIINEFKNCRKLNHPNIVKVYELYVDQGRARIYTIMELVQAQEMFQVIEKLGSYSEDIASKIFKQILSAIHYLHENMICHRDLKPNNILSNEDGTCVKITDFNVSKFGNKKSNKFEGNIKMWTYTGTVAFSAPEILASGEYDESVDMWSAGVVLYTMLSGKMPFEAEYLQDLIELIKIGEYEFPPDQWNQISESAKDLIKCCLQKNPKERITSDKALLHPWITQRQNTSPLTILTLKNLQDNKSKLVTKFAAYKELGLVKKSSRKKTINFTLYNNKKQKQNVKTQSDSNEELKEAYELEKDEIIQDIENSNDDDDEISIISDGNSDYIKIKSKKRNQEGCSSFDSDEKSEDQEQTQNKQQKFDRDLFNKSKHKSNIIHNRYQLTETQQIIMQKLEDKAKDIEIQQIKCQITDSSPEQKKSQQSNFNIFASPQLSRKNQVKQLQQMNYLSQQQQQTREKSSSFMCQNKMDKIVLQSLRKNLLQDSENQQ